MAAEDGSFISRWSRRKARAREAAPPQPAPVTSAPCADAALAPADTPAQPPLPAAPPLAPLAPAIPALPAPTLEDVGRLTLESDYTRFVAREVTPEVRNAALKKLFSDPQFNVMDGLDTYVGDYHTPDPLPAGMLRQMVQSKLLGLFEDDAKEAGPSAPAAPATPAAKPQALPPIEEPLLTEPARHEDADLQLQPDDDTGRPGAAPCAGADAGRQH